LGTTASRRQRHRAADRRAQGCGPAEAIARIAREQSEARGYDSGMAKAKAEMDGRIAELDQKVRQIDALLQFISRPLQSWTPTSRKCCCN